MSDPPETIYNICGHRWEDVTNQTCCEPTYPLIQVIRAGGRIPSFASTEGYKMPYPDKSKENGRHG